MVCVTILPRLPFPCHVLFAGGMFGWIRFDDRLFRHISIDWRVAFEYPLITF
jgi:hypothetical protein